MANILWNLGMVDMADVNVTVSTLGKREYASVMTNVCIFAIKNRPKKPTFWVPCIYVFLFYIVHARVCAENFSIMEVSYISNVSCIAQCVALNIQ